MSKSIWPKNPPPLTELQQKAKADFLKLWHEVLPKKYGVIEKFNHECALLKDSVTPGCHTLEIGAGLGEHLAHEDLKTQNYTALEIRKDFVEIIKLRFPNVTALAGDIQEGVALPGQSFDRIIAIHVLEHLRDLPRALTEIRRLLKNDGRFVVVIPCEGGAAYSLARRISAQRLFEKNFNIPYEPIIKNEHVSEAWEILNALDQDFKIEKRIYWPLKVPFITTNLVIALQCRKK